MSIVSDDLAIRTELARIAQCSDAGTIEDYGERFTEDAVWEMPGVAPKRGREEICAAGRARRAEGATGPGSHSRHVISTVAVAVDGDLAVAESYWQFFVGTGGRPSLRAMGAYRDTFRRTPEGWRLAERIITVG